MTEQTRTQPGPVTPYLTVRGASDASAFYQKAFGATELARMPAEDGKRLMHCQLKIYGGDLMMSDEFPEYGPQASLDDGPRGVVIHLQVPDAKAVWEKAVAAGATVVMPLELQFWGDYYGQLRDPFGHTWSVGQTGAK